MRSVFKFFFATVLAVSLNASELWLTDAAKAKEQAAKEGKPVLMQFTGSDWCPPCKLVKANVFEKPEFKAYATNVVLLEIDFPLSKKQDKATIAQNEKLQEEYKIVMYPTVVVLDKAGKEVGRVESYEEESAADYIKKIDSVVAKAK